MFLGRLHTIFAHAFGSQVKQETGVTNFSGVDNFSTNVIIKCRACNFKRDVTLVNALAVTYVCAARTSPQRTSVIRRLYEVSEVGELCTLRNFQPTIQRRLFSCRIHFEQRSVE